MPQKKSLTASTSSAAVHRRLRSKQLARAVALVLAATGGSVHAEQAFSPAWFANKGAVQSNVASTGRLPNGQSAAAAARPQQQRASEQAQRSINNLHLAARAIAAQQAAQTAARQAAQQAPSDIPDGLTAGGLQVDTNPLTAGWINAHAPVQTVSDGRTNVTIEQTGDKAILNWETFNVGRNTTVNFEQEASWTALNRVNDPQARPSRIAGQIKADGAVYIINRNGVIFTGSSQINTASLTASALNISDEKFKTNFISTSWDQSGPTFSVDNGFEAGAIEVQAGAQIEATKNGRIVLLGGEVRNEGALRANDGQVLLGASKSSVYLAASDDPAMRGLRIEVGGLGGLAYNGGIIDTPRGNATLAAQDVTLGALDANGQRVAGVLTASTTVTANGSITVQAADQAGRINDDAGGFLRWEATRTGALSVESGAIVHVLPELQDTTTVASDALLYPSRIDLYAKTVYIGGGAMLQALGGDISLSALDRRTANDFVDASQIYIDQGAILDASGTRDVALSVLRNFVQVELRGAELADNPLNYDALYGKKVWVDIRDRGLFDDSLMESIEWLDGETGAWQGSPLFNATGYIGLIQRGVGELTSGGGNIDIEARGDVIVRESSQLNVSGGTIDYSAAMTPVSHVVDAGGRLVPVGDAEYGQMYSGVAGIFSVNHARWGVKEQYANPVVPKLYRYEEGYTDGQAAGRVSLTGERVVADGDIYAVAEAGERQQREGEVPVGGTLVVGIDAGEPMPLSASTWDYGLGSDVLIQQQAAAGAPVFGEALDEDAVTVLSAQSIENGGIGTLEVHSNGAIVLDDSVDLDLGAGGRVQLGANNITVDGTVHAAGGSIELHADKTYEHTADTPTIAVGGTAMLDTAGQWTNAYADGAMPGVVDGGTVSLLTQGIVPTSTRSAAQVAIGPDSPEGSITVAKGAIIDVSGGGRVDRSGELTDIGDAGSITIGSHNVELSADVDLRGYALATDSRAGRGGNLTLIGAASVIGAGDVSGADAASGDERRLTADFFHTGGFAGYSIDGVESLTLEAGTQLQLAQSNRFIPDPRRLATGTALADLGEVTTLAAGIRPASSLTLRAGLTTSEVAGTGTKISSISGSVLLGSGSLVDVGIGGAFSTMAPDQVVISGTVRAPGGAISAGINVPGVSTTPAAPRAVWLTDEARLLAYGALLPTPNIHDQNTGEVLAGGTVTLDAAGMGYIVIEASSVIDVSGAVAQVDVPDEKLIDRITFERDIAPAVREETVWSDAGSIVVTMRDGGYLDGDTRAHAVHESAAAGQLSVLIGTDPSNVQMMESNANPRTLFMGQARESRRPEEVTLDADGRITQLWTSQSPQGSVYVSADSVARSGAGSLELSAHNSIVFQGDVNLSLSGTLQLEAATLQIATVADAETARVNLSAAHVSIGATDAQLLRAVPATVASAGGGELSIQASELLTFGGRATLANIDSATFQSGGDLRFDGALIYQPLFDSFGDPIMDGSSQKWGFVPDGMLSAAGDLTFGARQLYPGIGTPFTVSTSGEDATLSILPGDVSAALPMSAGGQLTLQAANIVNAGVLRAPLGQITLDAGDTGTVTLTAGSLIDVSAHGQKLPYGTVINGDWYINYGMAPPLGFQPAAESLASIQIPPGKQVRLSGESIDIQSGAVLDLSGGGDVVAHEFTPGTGGSRNVLEGAGVYAIVPGVQQTAAPLVGGSQIGVGESIYLSGVPGLAAGYYTLLPAQYASLPGAFRVSLTGASGQQTGLVGTLNDGSYLVSGWNGSTIDGSRDARNSTWRVMPAKVVSEYSEITELTGNKFFPALADKDNRVVPPLAADAGQIVLNAANALDLEGRFDLSAGEGGRGGLADIASSSIAVVADGAGPVDGYALTIEASALNDIGAQSLLLGGTRTSSTEGQTLVAVSDRILIQNDEASALTGPEIMLVTAGDIDADGGVAGTGAISVSAGAVIRAEGKYTGESTALSIGDAAATAPGGTGMGSLLVVSNAQDLVVQRHDISASGALMAGSIDVQAGASLTADESILFDATSNSVIDDGAEVRARSLEIASSTVSFGDAPADTVGFVATRGTLAALSEAERLVLRSYGSIDFHDNGSFDLRDPATGLSEIQELVLDAGALFQRGSGDTAVSARNLTLRNTSGSVDDSLDPGSTRGSLLLDAERLQIEQGESQLLGFSTARLAAGQVEFAGRGALTASGAAATNMEVAAPVITTASGADQSLAASGALHLTAGAHARPTDDAVTSGTGGALDIKGAIVDVDTQVLLPAGVLTVEATQGLAVSSNAVLDVSGREETFFDQKRTLPAGTITLVSQTGDVLVRSGAQLNLTDSKDGGKLAVTVPEGSFTIEGQARGGEFALDAGRLPGFGAMQAVLNQGGFAVSRSVRLRSGDALIDGVTRTRNFSLSTDDGGITVTGTIDASGPTGGSIKLAAADDIVLAIGSKLSVVGESFDGSGKGGSVSLSAGAHRIVDGEDVTNYDAVVDIQAGSLIDLGVANAAAAAKVVSLDAIGSSVALPAANSLGFPDGTPADTQIVSSVAATIVHADGTTAELAANTPVSLPKGATLKLSGAGTVSVASGSGKVAVVLPTTGAFATNGATTVSSVPVTLNAPGSTITLAGGTPVILPNGTPGDDIITTDSDSVSITTVSEGSQVTVTAGASSLELSAGSSITVTSGGADAGFTVGDGAVTIAGGTTTQGSAVVTLSRSGGSVKTADAAAYQNILTFHRGLPAGSSVAVEDPNTGASPTRVEITPPSGTTGTVTVNGNGAIWMPNGGTGNPSVTFPSGSPAGATLTSPQPVIVYASDGTATNIAANQPYVVPAGGRVQANSTGQRQIHVTGSAASFQVMLDSRGYTGTTNYTIVNFPETLLNEITPQTQLKVGTGQAQLRSADNTSIAVTLSGTWNVTNADVNALGTGVKLQYTQGGTFAPTGLGDLAVNLGTGGQFTANHSALGRLSAGTVLALEQDGQLQFASGAAGSIPILVPAGASFASNDASVFNIGGGQAGTLHLRAPQINGGTELGIAPIDGTILGAASIIAEGYKVYDLTDSNGVITSAVQDQVRTDATNFGTHAAAIEQRLLANNEGLASVLSVAPGAEIINTNSDTASELTAQIGANGTLGLPANVTVTLPNGLSDGKLVGPASTIDMVVPPGGASIALGTSGSMTVAGGMSIGFPEGTPTGTTVSTSATGTIIEPDGTTRNMSTFTQYTLQPGSTVILRANGVLTTRGIEALVATIPGGSYSVVNASFLSLPAGTTMRMHAGGNFSLQAVGGVEPAALSLVVPTGGEFVVDGVSFGASMGGAAQLTLVTPQLDGVSLAPGASLKLPNGGSVRVSAAGTVYAADGSVVSTFNADDIVTVAAGSTIQLSGAGTVTTQQSNLTVAVTGAGYTPASPVSYTQLLMSSTASTMTGTAGSSIKLNNLTNTLTFSIRSSVAATVYAADGSVRTTIAAGALGTIRNGETIQLSGAGTLTLNTASRNILGVVTSGSFTAGGNTVATEIPVPTATMAAASGDVRLPTAWDLADYRFGAERVAGILTLRAAGDVRIDASLSDGFAGGVDGTALLDDQSWSYRFVGGADFGAADVLAVRPEFQLMAGKGNVIINPSTTSDTRVRTGTGSIDIAAGRDIELPSILTPSAIRYSGVYTAGRAGSVQPGGGSFSTLADGRSAYSGGRFALAEEGGDVSLSAQRDIIGAARDSRIATDSNNPQDFSDWLLTQGATDPSTGVYTTQPAWGVAYGSHKEGAATLGGGNLEMSAGRDVLQMNIAAANSGVYVGASPGTTTLQTWGGGDVSVAAGRDVLGTQIYVAEGAGTLNVGRDLGAVSGRSWGSAGSLQGDQTYYSRLALGDATFDVVARGDAFVGAVFNPTLTYELTGSGGVGVSSYLSTYTDRSAVSVASIAGDVWLSADPNIGSSGNYYDIPNAGRIQQGFTYTLYPGNVEAVSFAGDIKVGNSPVNSTGSGMIMAPAHDGDLTLLAADSVLFPMQGLYDGALRNVVMSDADPSALLTPTKNISVLAQALMEPVPGYYPAYDRSRSHSESLYRAEDTNPVRIYAVAGDIVSEPFESRIADGATIVVPKPAEIRAGRDIIDLAFVGQHFTDEQTTVIAAGRDFIEKGVVEIDGWPEGNGIWIGGPGRLEMSAGRNFDLAKSAGIVSLGDQLNPFLPDETSADISLTVGAGAHGPDYTGFAATYLDPAASSGRHNYASDLLAFMRKRSGDQSLDAAQAWTLFGELPEGARNAFVRAIYFKELARVGSEGIETGNYNAGYDAVATLFPTEDENGAKLEYAGNLSLRYSTIKSVYDGSIELLVPGGGINGGVAVVGPEIGATRTNTVEGQKIDALKNANQLGIVALEGGDIRIMSYDDVIVNQSRVFAIGGGDLIVWSSEGDINAGKGAKTALLAPPPRLVFDPTSGSFELELTGAATGSGLATLITEAGQEPGNVWLMAPHGTVDAGDAGIRVSGNLIVAAQEVRGVDNIEVEGLSFGVPTNTVNVAALTDASAAASQAATTAQDVIKRERANGRDRLPSVFDVRVLGFGNESSHDNPKTQPRYNPNGVVQVLGAGELTEAERQPLNSAERRALDQ